MENDCLILRGGNNGDNRVYATFNTRLTTPQLLYTEPIFYLDTNTVDSIIIVATYSKENLILELIENNSTANFLSLNTVTPDKSGQCIELLFNVDILTDPSKVNRERTLENFNIEKINTITSKVDLKKCPSLTPKVCDVHLI